MLTDQDMSRLERTFVTKKEFNNTMKNLATKQELRSLENRFDSLEGRFDHLESRFDDLFTVVDKTMGHIARIQDEMAVSAVQYQRQMEWNHKVAKKVNVPFDY